LIPVSITTRVVSEGAFFLPRSLDAVAAGHAHVHHDHVGTQPRCERDRLRAVGDAPDDVEALAGEQLRQACREEVVVVGTRTLRFCPREVTRRLRR
jgi:hypothetical protein